MFNNINDSNKDLLYTQLSNTKNIIDLTAARNMLHRSNNSVNPYVDKTEISSNAMQLFQRDLDINKFTKIAAEDPNDTSFLTRMQELFADGVVDPFEDDVIKELADNSKLWEDIQK